MDELTLEQEISLMSSSGREMLSRVVDLVHMKLGNKAFKELSETPVALSEEFFWKYLKFEWNPRADPVAELSQIHSILDRMENHPDIQEFLS